MEVESLRRTMVASLATARIFVKTSQDYMPPQIPVKPNKEGAIVDTLQRRLDPEKGPGIGNYNGHCCLDFPPRHRLGDLDCVSLLSRNPILAKPL